MNKIESSRSWTVVIFLAVALLMNVGNAVFAADGEKSLELVTKDVSAEVVPDARGRFTYFFVRERGWPNWPGRLVYQKDQSHAVIPLAGSSVSISEVVRCEYPDGVSESFLQHQLLGLLEKFNDYESVVLAQSRERIVAAFGENRSQHDRELLGEIASLPEARVGEDWWGISYSTFNVRGGIEVRFCGGSRRPFSIDLSMASPLLPNLLSIGDVDQPLLTRAMNKRSAFVEKAWAMFNDQRKESVGESETADPSTPRAADAKLD